MKPLEFPLNPDGSIPMRSAAAASDRKITVNSKFDTLRSISSQTWKLWRRLGKMVDLSSNFKGLNVPPASDDCQDYFQELEDTWEATLYKASEIFELYQTELQRWIVSLSTKQKDKTLNEQSKAYAAKVKHHADGWDMATNAIKHHANSLRFTLIQYANYRGTTISWSLMRLSPPDKHELNRNFHKRGKRSITLLPSIAQLTSDIIEVDAAAAKLIANLPEEPTAPPLPAYTMSISCENIISALSNSRMVLAPDSPHLFRFPELQSQTLYILDKNLPAILADAQIKTQLRAIAGSRVFEFR